MAVVVLPESIITSATAKRAKSALPVQLQLECLRTNNATIDCGIGGIYISR